MPSLYDVAKLAGVSKTLVSRVINAQTGVSAASKEKIQAAMKELNYKPNAIARSLVLQKTKTIGVVMDNLCETYFFELLNGIEHEVTKTDYDVVFCSGRNRVNLKNRYIKYFTQGRADGVIIYGSNLDDEDMIEQMSHSNFPFVVVENDLAHLNINNIVVDNEFGSKLAINHLVDCGCNKIYYISGDPTIRAAIDRQNGYVNAMKQHGFEVNDDMILQADFTIETGYKAIKDFLDKNGRAALPQAFYCGSDNTAFGALMALEDFGLKVPEDIMIVGFDDDRPPQVDRPLKKLTTLSQPLYKIGASAVKMLLDEIEGRETKNMRLAYYPELIIRETTKKTR